MIDDDREPGMVKDVVRLSDGRYLIFYTFVDGEETEDADV